MLSFQKIRFRSGHLGEAHGKSLAGRTSSGIVLAMLLAPLVASAQAVSKGASPPSATVPRAAVELAAAASEAIGKRDYASAIQNLSQATRIAPDVAEFQANLGMAYYWAGRPKDAIVPCRKALKLKPSLAFAHYFLELSLAENGECKAALPKLEKVYGTIGDPQIKRLMGLDGARCTMMVADPFQATTWLQWLNRDFPDDPDVLYLGTRVYSDLSTLTSQHLLRVAPGSYQARQMDAEVLEIQGRNSEALAEYRRIEEAAPRLPGIHYHIGRLLLSGGQDPGTVDAARGEFEEELQINPDHAASEYELGEMARVARHWNEAIEHFGRAVKIDPSFTDALIGLGKSLVSAGRAAEALAPLENCVRLAPANPVAHYQLSFAYLRLGREADAKKELALYRQAQEEQHEVNLAIRQGMTGGISNPQTAEPPE